MQPNLDDIPIMVLSKDRHNQYFTSASWIVRYFPRNPKFIVVPASQVKQYNSYMRTNYGDQFTIVREPSKGLAAAETFINSDAFPGLPDKFRMPFIFKTVDDIEGMHLIEKDQEGKQTLCQLSLAVFRKACTEMLGALYDYGGHLAGFQGANPKNATPDSRYNTGLVTVMDSLVLRRRTSELDYPEDLAVKSDWVVVSRAFASAGFVLRCEYISISAPHFSLGGHGTAEVRQALEVQANKKLLKCFGVSSIRFKGCNTSVNWRRYRGRISFIPGRGFGLATTAPASEVTPGANLDESEAACSVHGAIAGGCAQCDVMIEGSSVGTTAALVVVSPAEAPGANLDESEAACSVHGAMQEPTHDAQTTVVSSSPVTKGVKFRDHRYCSWRQYRIGHKFNNPKCAIHDLLPDQESKLLKPDEILHFTQCKSTGALAHLPPAVINFTVDVASPSECASAGVEQVSGRFALKSELKGGQFKQTQKFYLERALDSIVAAKRRRLN